MTILLITLYTSLLMTFTRGAWIALFLSGIFVLLSLSIYRRGLLRENRRRLLVLSLAFLVVTAIYSTPNPLNPQGKNVVQRGLSAVNLEQGSIQQRFLIWLSTLELIKERPLTGWGVGTFGLQYPFAQGKVLACEENRKYIPQANKSINAHNDYLHLWAEAGIIGLACFMWIVVLFYRRCFRFLRKMDKEDGLLVIGLTGSSTAILAHSFFSFPFHVIQNGLLFWLSLSLGTLLCERKMIKGGTQNRKSLEKNRKSSILRRAVQVGLVLAAISLGAVRLRIFIADTHLKTAEMLMEVRAYPMAAEELRRAISIDPYNGLALANLGQVYDFLGRYGEAISLLKRAEKNWVYPGLYNNLGYAYAKLEDFEEAEKSFRKNILLFPNAPRPYLNLSHLFLSLAEKAISLKEMQLARKRLDEAFVWYEQGRVFNPHFTVPSSLSRAYRHLAVGSDSRRENLKIREVFIDPPFFSKLAFLDILPCVEEEDKGIFFELFLYLPEAINYKVDGAIEIRGENRSFFKKFILDRKNIFSKGCYLLSVQLKKQIPRGEYMAIARVRYGKGKLVMAKRKFFISRSDLSP